jgi:predicted nucleic acid-binding protein
MIVVSDTSPIRALAFLDQLSVLDRFFGIVVIPPAAPQGASP